MSMEMYAISGRIGEGAHGVVLKAWHNETNREVALKKVLLKKIEDGIPTSIIREIKCLQELNHPYIIKLLDAFPSGFDFVMVFDYMPSGLWESIKDIDRPLNCNVIKRYFKMLLEGVAFMHGINIIHRDLKPANLLINHEGILKIADFGLARLIHEDVTRPYSHQVATRWYRAPELLYGGKFYNMSIDMWSVGCIFAEMLNNSPLFPGENDIEQLAIVLKQLGTPTAETWPDLASLPDYNKITFPYHIGASWEEIISDATPEALDVIKKLLLYDSSKRLSANEILHHSYFYTPPYPCLIKQLPKPLREHRDKLRQKTMKTDVKLTKLFHDLITVTN